VKRFRFRLEQVLHVRRVQEDQAKAALLTANRAAHDAAQLVESRLAEYHTRSFPPGAQSYAEFERNLFLLDSAAGAVGVARAAHHDALAVVDDRRLEYTTRHRRVAALERLESRRREEHKVEMRREEDRLVDDLVVSRYSRVRPALTKGSR
jgi:flagellar export protein FliJ